MVNKSIKCAQRTGNSIHFNLAKKFYSRHGDVSYELYSVRPDREKTLERKSSVLDDGLETVFQVENDVTMAHLSNRNRFGFDDNVMFSLNKRKRWKLASYLEDEMENLKDEEFRVVVWERKLPMMHYSHKEGLSSYISSRWNDCVRYIDSKTAMTSASCGTAASHFSDLRLKCMTGGKLEGSKAIRRRKNHNRHFRGIQRKTELSHRKTEKPDNSQRHTARGLLAGEDNEDIPEIRYQICQPSKCTSRFNIEGSSLYWPYLRNRGDKFPSSLRSFNRKALKKQKGCRSRFDLQSWTPLDEKKFRKELNCGRSFKLPSRTKSCQRESEVEICLKCHKYDADLYGEDLYQYVSEHDVCNCFDSHDCHHDEFKVKDKIEVDMLDLIKNTKQKKKSVKRKRRRAEEDEMNDSKKGHVIFYTEDNSMGNETMAGDDSDMNTETQNELKSTAALDIPLYTVKCLLRKRDVQECMNENGCMYSSSTMPTKLLVPIYKHSQNELQRFNIPYLIVEETLSSLSSDYEEGIGTYRLRIHWDKEQSHMKNATDELQRFISQDEFLIFSVQDIIKHLQISLEMHFVGGIHEKEFEDDFTILNGIWSWIPSVRYKVKSVKEAANYILYTQHSQSKNSESVIEKRVVKKWNEEDCGVCYTSLNECHEFDGTILLPCQHTFCNTCLGHYATERIRNGALYIQCMEYKCTSKIDDITVLSLISSKAFNQWIERRQENTLVKSGNWKYCPNNKCSRVLCVENSELKIRGHFPRMSVKCHCNQEFCVQCQSPPHWPSTCKQMELYKKLLEQNGQWNTIGEQKSYFVHVKSCPKCKEKIEKNGGCPCMTCKCSHQFCWICLRPYSTHYINGARNCGQSVSEQVVELHNRKFANLPSVCYEQSLIHRKAWTEMSEKSKKEIFRCFSANKVFGRFDTQKLIFFNQQIRHFDAVKEVHKLVENVYSSLSNSTRKARSRHHINMDGDRIFYIAKRIVELLKSSSDPDVNQRIQNLLTILQETVRVFVSKAMHIQRLSEQVELKRRKFNITYRYV